MALKSKGLRAESSLGGRIPIPITHEDYRRLEGFVGDRELAPPSGEPLGRYLIVNFTLLGMGLAAWSGVVAALIWILF